MTKGYNMIRYMLIFSIVVLSFMVPFPQYAQSKAADNSKDKSSQMPVPTINLPEDEIKKLEDQGFFKAPMASVFNLSEDEIKKLQDEALRGAPDPAYRLFLFYELFKKDSKESNFGAVIAAENGDPKGEYNLALTLDADPDPRNRKRARFWLERAAKSGNKSIVKKAAAKLKRINKKESKEKED
ncbi:MAG: hypothetical protein ACYDIC_13285 [Desulfobaccales bacterium]